MSRTLVDSSTIIALSRFGELNLLKIVFGEIHITPSIREEILVEGYPETDIIRKAMDEWIDTVDEEHEIEEYRKHGIGRGEASIIAIARKSDRLVLDDLVARDLARLNGLSFTGLIGLLVEVCEAELVSVERARDILDKLSRSDFRITAELYGWALDWLNLK